MNETLPALPQTEGANRLLFDTAIFEHVQRVATVFANSTMVPAQFRGNIGNCVIALNLAHRMKLDCFMVMQKMYIVHGTPGIESQLAIAVVNATGKFTPIQYQMAGAQGTDSRACVAYATRNSSGELCEGPEVSIKMAQDEGWLSKSGSKWKTMPELMLRYRAAMFFARLYCPEALLGMETADELQDYMPMKQTRNGTFEVVSETTKDLNDKLKESAKDQLPETKQSIPMPPVKPPRGNLQKRCLPGDLKKHFQALEAKGDETLIEIMMRSDTTKIPSKPEELEELWRKYSKGG